MSCRMLPTGVAVTGVLGLCMSALAGPVIDSRTAAQRAACSRHEPVTVEREAPVGMRAPLAILDAVAIPQKEADLPVTLLRSGRGTAGMADAAIVYENGSPVIMSVAIPNETSPPYWLADDMELELPEGATEWEVWGYSYTVYAFADTAPYHVYSSLYRFAACTSTPTPLADWFTGDCCVDAVEIVGTGVYKTITYNGIVEMAHDLPAPVVVDKNLLMLLEFSGSNVAGNAGWIVAYDCEDGVDVGFTDDLWIEDVEGVGCGAFSFGGDPYAGFAATILGKPAAVMEMIPVWASGGHTISGNEIVLDPSDLPQCVRLDVYARDWDPDDSGVKVKGYQNELSCDSYYTAVGTLTASNYDCSLFQDCDGCTMGIEQGHPDIIWGGGYPAC